MASAPLSELDENTILRTAERLLASGSYRGCRVFRCEQVAERLWWAAFATAGKAKTAILDGVPGEWEVLHVRNGWPVT
jgi:hypothetical protein